MIRKVFILCIAYIFLASCTKTIPQTTKDPHQQIPEIPEIIESQPEENKTAKNVIFLIGDGMGIGQITGGMYKRGNKTVFEKFPVVGLHKSHSSNNLVTDSAAGATAFACGVKTYNGAIGVDEKGSPRRTILETAEMKGMATGLLATSTIVHATPASFFAHVKNRRQYEDIALFFLKTEIDLIIGGGKKYFTRRKDDRDLYEEMRKRNYVVSDYFEQDLKTVENPEGKNLLYITSDSDPLPKDSGRDYLIHATQFSLEFLNDRSDEGFFVMIEGSQIDWGGHANDGNYVLSEILEFEKVISIARKFAESDGNTLVIVTGDHETGGFAINPESTMGDLNIAFTTGGHTACMIPVFAYGPGSEEFGGIYDNTAIYRKLKKVLDF